MAVSVLTGGDERRLVLCYHAVSDDWTRPLSVTPRNLEAQVGDLARRGWTSHTFTEAATGSAAGRASVAITFDDAYRSVVELAKPILDRHEMVATVFAPTELVGTERPMSWAGIDEWQEDNDRAELVPMSWQELRDLAAAGWEIGSHTRKHPHLTALADRKLEEELAGSKLDVEGSLGAACTSIAYPYGDFDGRVVQAAKACGYRAGATLAWGLPDAADPLACPRVGVYHRDGMQRFRVKSSDVARRLLALPAVDRLAGVLR